MQGSSPLITYPAAYSVKDIIDRIEKILKEKSVTIFARINHGQEANNAGLAMQDEELIIFGNPKVGTALMIERPAIGIELPLKIIAWNDNQQTIVAYQDLDKLADTFHIQSSRNTITSLNQFMKTLVESVIK